MGTEELGGGRGTLARLAWRPVLTLAAIVCGLHGVVASRYGWHRDEFYYVAAGRRLAWGYVDQPPLTPVLARAAASLGGGLVPLRVTVIGVQVALIITGALIARELGGGQRAQVLTSGCVAGCAVFVGASLFLGTTPVDQLLWGVVLWLVLRALRLNTVRAWIAVGVAAGVGLENKHTIVVLLFAVVISLWRPRRDVNRWGGLLAGVVAVAIWSPNLWWDARHHWVTLDMARALSAKQGGIAGAAGQLPLLLLIFPGPAIVFIWIRGARWLARDTVARRHRWLLVVTVLVVVIFVAVGGKPYYPAPVLVALFAAGCVATEQGARERSTRPIVLVGASIAFAFVLSLPVLPASFASRLRDLNKEPMETYGWQAISRQVVTAAETHPAVTAVFASNYGEAGAIAYYGPSQGLTVPVVSGHNAYGYWGPPDGTPSTVIAVGEFDAAYLRRVWTSVTPIAPLQVPGGLRNEETVNQATIFLCSEPTGTWAELWPQLTHLG